MVSFPREDLAPVTSPTIAPGPEIPPSTYWVLKVRTSEDTRGSLFLVFRWTSQSRKGSRREVSTLDRLSLLHTLLDSPEPFSHPVGSWDRVGGRPTLGPPRTGKKPRVKKVRHFTQLVVFRLEWFNDIPSLVSCIHFRVMTRIHFSIVT